MKIKNIVVTATLILAASAASAAAFAESPYPSEQKFVSTKTRAQVVEELKQAGGNPARDNYAATFAQTPLNGSEKTRAQVLAELQQAGNDPSRSNYQTSTH